MGVKHMNSIHSTKTAIRIGLLAGLCLGLLPALGIAHNGEEHVTGTVAKISDTSVTVTTVAGKTVEVALDAKTTFTRSAQPIQKVDLKLGERVVIHAAEVHEKLIAHTVQVGVPPAAKQTAQH